MPEAIAHGDAIAVRDGIEIQRAHDLLWEIHVGRMLPGVMRETHVALDVLCWVLQHQHNRSFADNLRKLEQQLRNLGYELHDSGGLQQR